MGAVSPPCFLPQPQEETSICSVQVSAEGGVSCGSSRAPSLWSHHGPSTDPDLGLTHDPVRCLTACL